MLLRLLGSSHIRAREADPQSRVVLPAPSVRLMYADETCAVPSQVHDWRHVFLYSDDPDWSTVRFDEMSVIHPNDDALTASLKSVMRHVCRTRQLPAERCYPPGSPADVDIRKRPSATTLSRDKRRSAATFAGTGRAVTE